jgi:hypothetical protein
VNPIVREIHAMDPTIPVYDVRTMEGRMYDSLARQRFATLMLGAFGAFALILASRSLWRHLIPRDAERPRYRIAHSVGRKRAGYCWAGCASGYGIGGYRDGLRRDRRGSVDASNVQPTVRRERKRCTFTSASLILVLVAFLASFFPARRATRIDPMAALREE